MIRTLASLIPTPANTDAEVTAALLAASRAATDADALARFRSQLGLDGDA